MKKLVPMVLLALTACSANHETPTEAPVKRGVVVFEVGGDYSFASYDDNFQNGIQYHPGQTRVELKGDNVPQSPKPLYTWANSGEGRETHRRRRQRPNLSSPLNAKKPPIQAIQPTRCNPGFGCTTR